MLNRYIFHFNNCCLLEQKEEKCWQARSEKCYIKFYCFHNGTDCGGFFYRQKMSENWKFLQKLFYWKNCNLKSPDAFTVQKIYRLEQFKIKKTWQRFFSL
jgi:hypothetical protein